MRWPMIPIVTILVSCAAGPSASPGLPAEPTRAPAAPVPVASKPPDASVGEDGGTAKKSAPAAPQASDAAPASTADEPRHCPEGMVFVEGDYCTDIEQKCLQSWYDPSNKKTVCEVFEPPSRCVGKRVSKRFCIDQYAWPNIPGERSEVMNRFHQAQVKCAAVGKRLCTESEWTFACEGPEAKPFPYGYIRDTRKCNGDHMWDNPDMAKVAARDAEELARLWRGVRSGGQPDCISDFGVADLPGDVDEVVSSETLSAGWRGKFDSVHTGGPWYKGVRNQCRPKIYTHDEGFYYYFLGFRCCAEPDGQQTDPRTLKQRQADWGMERVERIAGFTREDVRRLLKLKAQNGHCGCSEIKAGHKRILCDTICGTLLGPTAKDAVQPPAQGLPPFGAQKRATPAEIQRALEASQRPAEAGSKAPPPQR